MRTCRSHMLHFGRIISSRRSQISIVFVFANTNTLTCLHTHTHTNTTSKKEHQWFHVVTIRLNFTAIALQSQNDGNILAINLKYLSRISTFNYSILEILPLVLDFASLFMRQHFDSPVIRFSFRNKFQFNVCFWMMMSMIIMTVIAIGSCLI